MHVRGGVGIPDGAGITARYHRPLPPLRVTEEELRGPRPGSDSLAQRIVSVEMPSNTHHPPSLVRGTDTQPVKPPWARPRAMPTNPAMMPVTMSTRCSLVAEIICV